MIKKRTGFTHVYFQSEKINMSKSSPCLQLNLSSGRCSLPGIDYFAGVAGVAVFTSSFADAACSLPCFI